MMHIPARPQQTSPLSPAQERFLSLLIKSEALMVRETTLKSGRVSPYFINLGAVSSSGPGLDLLGQAYADLIIRSKIDTDFLFGPAYKGIPLAAVTALSLARDHNREVAFAADRKEEKTHGDKGAIIGAVPTRASKICLVDDVMTADTTLGEINPFLRYRYGARVSAVVLAVDRCEKASPTSTTRASTEIGIQHGVTVYAILTVHEIFAALSKPNPYGKVLSSDEQHRFQSYLSQYGA